MLLLPPTLKWGELQANGEYEQLAEVYPKVVNEGQLNGTLSGEWFERKEFINLEFKKRVLI